jgi:hypothetical protein
MLFPTSSAPAVGPGPRGRTSGTPGRAGPPAAAATGPTPSPPTAGPPPVSVAVRRGIAPHANSRSATPDGCGPRSCAAITSKDLGDLGVQHSLQFLLRQAVMPPPHARVNCLKGSTRLGILGLRSILCCSFDSLLQPWSHASSTQTQQPPWAAPPRQQTRPRRPVACGAPGSPQLTRTSRGALRMRPMLNIQRPDQSHVGKKASGS